MEHTIRIGSRASRLAVIQSELVMAEIRRILPEASLELVTMKTTGDKILHKTLDKIGGKASFCTPLLFGFQVVSLLEILGAQLIGIAPARNTGKPLCSLS